jgi:Holliday junction resolvase RusA-like endonuclease
VCELVFILPRPKSAPKRTGSRLPHCKKPDAENLAKSVLDALSGLLYDDDRQIWRLVVEKWVAAVDEQPQVTIHVREVEE